ncbi:unnamed protein product [Lactuca virosa]|uniref:Uncharacterized protein n=1 Tax=Lactuca virosa TaxID=75947 RepID=A0AAU9M185_9ASTR|nr:unnamed protein product [Lactuca virosa]
MVFLIHCLLDTLTIKSSSGSLSFKNLRRTSSSSFYKSTNENQGILVVVFYVHESGVAVEIRAFLDVGVVAVGKEFRVSLEGKGVAESVGMTMWRMPYVTCEIWSQKPRCQRKPSLITTATALHSGTTITPSITTTSTARRSGETPTVVDLVVVMHF